MPYITDLSWITDLAEFDDDEKKVLLALSHDKYKWRTKDRLLNLTRLDSKRLDSILAKLIEKDLVRPAFSKKRDIVFGLRERVAA